MVLNAQLKSIYSLPPMNFNDGASVIKFAGTESSCVNILTHFNYVGDLNSERDLGSATRRLTKDMEKVAHVCQANEPVLTWTRCVQ